MAGKALSKVDYFIGIEIWPIYRLDIHDNRITLLNVWKDGFHRNTDCNVKN